MATIQPKIAIFQVQPANVQPSIVPENPTQSQKVLVGLMSQVSTIFPLYHIMYRFPCSQLNMANNIATDNDPFTVDLLIDMI